MAITLKSTLREILRLRPRAVEVFETAVGGDFWNGLDYPLEDLCAEFGLVPATLLHRLEDLPHTLGNLDWSKSRLYELVDRLAADHRDFRDTDLPRLEQLIDGLVPASLPSGFPLEELRLEFHSFKIDFLLHMNEEEDFLFPKALRTEASVDHPQITSESFRGSVGAYSPVMLNTPEVQIKHLVAGLVARARSAEEAPTPELERLRGHLEDFATRIVRHADLEIEYLLPRTLAQERLLQRRAQESHSGAEG